MATTLMPYRPFADLGELRDRLDRVFGDIFEDLTNGKTRTWTLSIDVVEKDDRYVLRADLPGLTLDEVKIEVEDDVLTISGEHEETETEEKEHFVRRERRRGSFFRSLRLPAGVRADDIEAGFEDGMLEVVIPKTKEEKEKKYGKAVKIASKLAR